MGNQAIIASSTRWHRAFDWPHKHGGQLGRSRMKSDATTKSAGYAAVFGFNLRQLTRYITGEVRPQIDKMANLTTNDANSTYKMAMQGT